ncbi:MAG: hypothetical protein EBR82_84270 [Caulobacteraceae bacterium]|nr:hypothetical protein [Caulobacteraceae bacterium]
MPLKLKYERFTAIYKQFQKQKTMLNKENIKHALKQYVRTIDNIRELCGAKNISDETNHAYEQLCEAIEKFDLNIDDKLLSISDNPEFKAKFKELQAERKYWMNEIGQFIAQKTESNEQ